MLKLCRADKILLTGGAAMLGSSALLGSAPLVPAVAAGTFAAVLADGIFRPSSNLFYPTICHGPRDRPAVALTFDDGPHPRVTPAVLDALAEFRARATFFVIGRHLERNASIAERAVAEGHELGNHSWTHSYFQNFYTGSRHGAEIDRAAELIKHLSSTSAPPWYRPPVGLKSPALARAAYARQLRIVAWSLHTRDTMSRDAEAIAVRTLARIKPGDIVLMHDGHHQHRRERPLIISALPRILRGLQERGLAAVSVSQLLSDAAPFDSTMTGR